MHPKLRFISSFNVQAGAILLCKRGVKSTKESCTEIRRVWVGVFLEKVSNRPTKLEAFLAFPLICIKSEKEESPTGWRCSNKSVKPMIAVKILLKSCAMPPVNCPKACIF